MLKFIKAGVLIWLMACSNGDEDLSLRQLSNLNVIPDQVIEDVTISFDLTSTSATQVVILSRWGKALHLANSDSISEGQHHFHFKVLDDPSGTYFVQVATELDTLKGYYQKIE